MYNLHCTYFHYKLLIVLFARLILKQITREEAQPSHGCMRD